MQGKRRITEPVVLRAEKNRPALTNRVILRIEFAINQGFSVLAGRLARPSGWPAHSGCLSVVARRYGSRRIGMNTWRVRNAFSASVCEAVAPWIAAKVRATPATAMRSTLPSRNSFLQTGWRARSTLARPDDTRPISGAGFGDLFAVISPVRSEAGRKASCSILVSCTRARHGGKNVAACCCRFRSTSGASSAVPGREKMRRTLAQEATSL